MSEKNFGSLYFLVFLFFPIPGITLTLLHVTICVLVVVWNIYNAHKQNSAKGTNTLQLGLVGSVYVDFLRFIYIWGE